MKKLKADPRYLTAFQPVMLDEAKPEAYPIPEKPTQSARSTPSNDSIPTTEWPTEEEEEKT
jgi:hypothetical protein